MKKISSIILALVLLISVTACSSKGADSDDPNIGMWNAVSASMLGFDQDITEVFDEGVSLELKDNDKYTLVIDGEKANGKWRYTDGGLMLSIEGVDFPGNVENGILTLTNMLDMGLDLIFEKEGGHPDAIRPIATEGAEGGEAVGDQHAGYYVLESGSEDGETITGDEFREMGFDYYVLLNEDGTAVCQTDDLATGTWENGTMTLQNDDGDTATINYELKGDALTIDWGGLIMVYVRSSDTPPTPIVDADALSELQQWWDGDWYGYWEPHSVTDDYKHLDDGRWDIYAVIDMNSDDTGTIYLWEDGEDFATVDITVSEVGGSSDMGAAVSESGHYWAGDEIGHADWIIDPSLYGYENYMVIDGHYEDEDDEGFYYVAYLRPWGQLWDDIPEDERSPYYEDWYLLNYTDPMIEAIRGFDGYIHSELVDILVAEQPASPTPSGGVATETPAPSVPSVSGDPIDVKFEMEGVMVSATLPAQGWCHEDSPFGYSFFPVESLDDVYSNTPRIRININPDLKHFDRYSDDFSNMQTIDNRMIGGIDMTGRAYDFVGMEWIEYIGMLDGEHAVSVNTSRVDISSGEGSAVIDSIKFNAGNATSTDVRGERISAGNVSALCPDGWKSYDVWDVFADDLNTKDPDRLKFHKFAETEDDQHLTPGLEIQYYGPDSFVFKPGEDWFDDTEDFAPMVIGDRTWEGITGTTWDSTQAIIWSEDGGDEFLIYLVLNYYEKSISLEDADVQAIIASIEAP